MVTRAAIVSAWIPFWLLLALPSCRVEIRERDPAVPLGGAASVLLVTVDTLRADHCSAYGYPRPTTPTLERAAARGTLFEQAYTVTPTTGPAHATLFTSRLPDEHGVLRNGVPLGGSLPTLAELLRERGYATAAFVSSYAVNGRFGLDRGFDTYDDDFQGERGTMRPPNATWEGHRVDAPFDRRAGSTVDRTLEWLRSRDPERPFFVWVHLFDPHSPYDPPEPFRSRFLRWPAKSQRDQQIDLYDGDVAYADRELGRLLDAVDPETTLTVLTSDHGEGLWDHGWPDHGVHLYEEAVRVPLVIRWPGRVAAGARVPGPVALVDVLPTVLSLLDAPADGLTVRGRDLAPVLAGRAVAPAERAIFLQRRYYATERVRGVFVGGPKWGLRSGRWKVIEAPREPVELFDLEVDPRERENVADRHVDRVGRLRAMLASSEGRNVWVRRVGVEPLTDEVREKLRALGYVD